MPSGWTRLSEQGVWQAVLGVPYGAEMIANAEAVFVAASIQSVYVTLIEAGAS